jgi:hypothetical protein
LFLIFFALECSSILLSPSVPDCCPQELEHRAQARYDRLAQLSSELNWYRGQYDTLDTLIEALRTDNGWLEYRLRAVQDALLDQHAQTS